VILTLVLLCVALVPACVSWWSGRRLRRRLDDAAFPERLQAHRRTVLITSFVAGGVAVGMTPAGGVPVTIAVLLLALSVAAYPLRKAIYGETWSYAGYVSWMTRFLLAFPAFWLAIALTPFAILRIEYSVLRIAASLAAAAGFALWVKYFLQIAEWLLRPQPIADPDWLAAFGQILSRSTLSEARIEVVAPQGGAWTNAIALATAGDRRVWLGQSLLERLSADEANAVFAHEVAHLEQFTRGYLIWLRAIGWTAIGLATVGCAIASLLVPASATFWLQIGWGLAFLGLLALRGRGHQRRETQSDLRAAELCGDADAVVRGLVKLHAALRLPRRWAENVERNSTHPSLASRIRALREYAAAASPGNLEEAQVFATPGGALVLDGTRLHGLEGLADADGSLEELFGRAEKVRSLAYSTVRELRVDAGVAGQARLVARETSGHQWSVPIRDEDTARLQEVLDTIELHLASRVASAIPANAGRALAILAIALGISQSAWGLVLCASAAVIRLRPMPLVMMAAGAATSALLALLQPFSPGSILPGWFLVPAEAALAAAAVWLAFRQTRDESAGWDDGPPLMLAVVGVGALAAWAFALFDLWRAPGFVRAHQIAQATPAAAVLAAALATALLVARSRPRRTVGAITALIAIAAIAVASPAMLFSLERDPLLERTPAATLRPAQWNLHSVADVGEHEYNGPLRISPTGRRYAIGGRTNAEDEPIEFRIGDFSSGVQQRVRAIDVAWTSDDRLLVLTPDDGAGASELTLLDSKTWKKDPSKARSWSLPRIIAPRLSAVDGGRGWMLVGWTRTLHRRAVRLAGALDSADVERTEWDVPREGYIEAVTAGARGNALAVTYSMAGAGSLLWTLHRSTTMSWWVDSTIWALTPEGPRRIADTALTVRCIDTTDGAASAWCVAADSHHTIVYSVDVPLGRFEPVTTIKRPSRFESNGPDGSLVLWIDWTRPVIVRPREHLALELEDDAIPVALSSAARGGLVSFLSAGEHSGQIRVLELR
jgi:Zn-dependent protease with chaperone function